MGLHDFTFRVGRWTRASDDAHFFILTLDEVYSKQLADGGCLATQSHNFNQYNLGGNIVLSMDLRMYLKDPYLNRNFTRVAAPWVGTIISSPALTKALTSKDFLEPLFETFKEGDSISKLQKAVERIRMLINEDITMSVYREGTATRSVIYRLKVLNPVPCNILRD